MNWAWRCRREPRRIAGPVRAVRHGSGRRSRAERDPRASRSWLRGLHEGNEAGKTSRIHDWRLIGLGGALRETAAANPGVGGSGAAQLRLGALAGLGSGAEPGGSIL